MMEEITGDIWDYHKQGNWIVIPTNGTVKANGECVMGRGVALQAKRKFPNVPYSLGQQILKTGNVLHLWEKERLLALPVKHNYWEKASMSLIERGIRQLRDFFDSVITDYPTPVYMVRLGCGNGKLDWGDVKPILEKYLDDRFVVVERG